MGNSSDENKENEYLCGDRVDGVGDRELAIVLSQSKLCDAIPQVLGVISNLNWTVHES